MFQILVDTVDRQNRSVKLLKDKKVVDFRSGDIDIASAVKEILDKNNLNISKIDEFVSNPGPGSFTGIKIGITFVNVLNWILKKKQILELTKPNYGSEPNIHKKC